MGGKQRHTLLGKNELTKLCNAQGVIHTAMINQNRITTSKQIRALNTLLFAIEW